MEYKKLKFKNNPNPVQTELREKISALGENKTGNTHLYVKAFILFFLLTSCYTILVFANIPPPFSIAISITFGVVIAGIGFNIMHDGNHGSFSKRKWVNSLMGMSLNPLGGNAILWKKKHNEIHHTYTNIVDHDDDISFGKLLRIHKEQKWYWWNKYQHIYTPILYFFTYILWIYLFDFIKYFRGKICGRKLNFSVSDHFVFWLSKIFHVFIFIVIPLYFHTTFEVLTGYALATLTCGFILSLVFQPAHVVEQTTLIVMDKGQELLEEENAVHQIKTTADFGTKNKLLSWYVGGLNFQVEHHLFPKWSHVHYPKLQKIVKEVCEKFHLDYKEYPTFWSAIKSHFRLIKQFSKKPLIPTL